MTDAGLLLKDCLLSSGDIHKLCCAVTDPEVVFRGRFVSLLSFADNGGEATLSWV